MFSLHDAPSAAPEPGASLSAGHAAPLLAREGAKVRVLPSPAPLPLQDEPHPEQAVKGEKLVLPVQQTKRLAEMCYNAAGERGREGGGTRHRLQTSHSPERGEGFNTYVTVPNGQSELVNTGKDYRLPLSKLGSKSSPSKQWLLYGKGAENALLLCPVSHKRAEGPEEPTR